MNFRKVLVAVVAGWLCAAGAAQAQSVSLDDLYRSCVNNAKSDCESWAKQGGGGEAPRGLHPDTHAELAVGEKYILTGRIDILGNQPFLRISFSDQPWLANTLRVNDPYYRIADTSNPWKKYRGRTLSIIVTARYFAWSSKGKSYVEIYLEPASEPVLSALQR